MNLALAILILHGVNTRLTVEREAQIILEVAAEYGLTEEQTHLLCAIRRVENGDNTSGIEYGVGSDYPKHPARRFAGDPEKSLRLQAQYAAGTIKKRYTRDLTYFAKRWCPPNWANWERMVAGYTRKANAGGERSACPKGTP